MDERPPTVELQQTVAESLDRGATVITANQRTARTLRRAFDHRQRTKGLLSWTSPTILAWDSWMETLWRTALLEGHTTALLLNGLQEHTIWCSIIEADKTRGDVLRSVDGLAELAAEAWRLVAQYEASSLMKQAASSLDTRTYLRWAAAFDRRCKAQDWLSKALIEQQLHEAVQSGSVAPPFEVLLVGFDDITPARRRLLKEVTSAGAQVIEVPVGPLADGRLQVECSNDQDEILAVARWARNRLIEEPSCRLAVISPSLESRRSSIDRCFRHILSPHLEEITASNETAPYEFSIGSRLSDTPLVRVAMEILRWLSGPLPLERISALLVSPLFAMPEGDAEARSIFDAFNLRRAKLLLRPEGTIAWMIATARRNKKRPLPATLLLTLSRLEEAQERYEIEDKLRSFADWATTIRSLLTDAQWGHLGTEDSIEFQTRKRWESCLDELASLDFREVEANFSTALHSLERIVRTTIFTQESREAPVQILGPLEAAGAQFDAIWFLGAGDITWPTKRSGNALLPWTLQAQLGMPGDNVADDRRNLAVATRICASAPQVIFSYAAETEAGRQRLSPLLASLSLTIASVDSFSPEDAPEMQARLEPFFDTMPLPRLPERTIQGGAEILRMQAACGFRAFAEKRLLSSELRSVVLGMDAGERGTIVHEALESFWKKVGSQAALKALASSQLNVAITESVEESIQRALQSTRSVWDAAYVQVQRERLQTLLANWMEIERVRSDFEVLVSEKQFDDVKIGPLQLTVRVDRVDATEAGSVIIDYKTGSAMPSQWMGDRPDAPQLPLYAVLSSMLQPDMPPIDLAFANIHAGGDAVFDGYTGKTTRSGWRPNKKRPPIEEQLEGWKTVLTGLAESFDRGEAHVDPKQYPQTCKHCSQRTLCRLNPAAIDFDEELDEQAEGESAEW
ncbi:MAG: PD-(D/E)XK nuclease family protein [Edaphobacter sp.]|uniref:PD-(D/E)XK nuclease family protein n=1 Tax=Edaphobacter sp. TaxID=1934404 RepID=UPI00238B271A|nr:PD-(D/E)XK nuclease family protein [Edaphobacter sp.]MDE1175393.1 PD-(D/E)XK nuclease family protein [Edaphobacter sp.]